MVPRLVLACPECGGAFRQQGRGVEEAKVGAPEMSTRYCQAHMYKSSKAHLSEV